MTYCLGIKTNQNIVMLSDSRTNAGVDNVSMYSKMWRFGVPGDRQFVICSAGNLATSQSVFAVLERDIRSQAETSLLTTPDLHDVCEYIGRVNLTCQRQNTGGGPNYEATFLVAGEIKGAPSALHLIYPQGNFIASSLLVPFLQIGETKYGKPILDRVCKPTMSVERATLCGLVSMDATIRSNLTVGPPVELAVLDLGTFQPGRYQSFNEQNAFMQTLRQTWNTLMEDAVDRLPNLDWPPLPPNT